MLCSKNSKYIEYARFLSTQAKDKADYYEHSELGYNYRLSNICAAVGLGQLEILDEIIEIKRGHFKGYKEELSDVLLDYQHEGKDFFHTRWLSVFQMKDLAVVESTIKNLADANIEARRSWKAMHDQPLFSGTDLYGDKAFSEEIFKTAICLPSGAGMTEDERSRVIACIKQVNTQRKAG